MSEALQVYEPMELSVADVKKYIAPNATDKELFMFMGISKAYGLNPMKREVHFIKYGDSKANIVVGYESYLKKAERTGKLNGWEVEVSENNEKATITIHRRDWTQPFRWTVDRAEFDKAQSTWKAMPRFMLKKVAIAQGFRLAFPEDLGGMPYIPEEINAGVSEAQETSPIEVSPPKKETPRPTPPVTAPTVPQSEVFGMKFSPSDCEFWNLRSDSWQDYYEGMTQGIFNSWTENWRQAFIRKCETMTKKAGIPSPWPKPSTSPQDAPGEAISPPQANDPLSERQYIFSEATSLFKVNPELYGRAVSEVGCGYAAAVWSMDNLRAVSAAMDRMATEKDEVPL